MKRRLNIILITVVVLAVIFTASFSYYSFVSRTIYNESVSHLSEIFHQSIRSLQNFVDKNWNGIHMWADYLEDVSDENEISKYINHAKQEIRYTEFYYNIFMDNPLTSSKELSILLLKLLECR